MTDFWIKWLKGWSLFTIAFGAAFAVIDLKVLGLPAQWFTDAMFLRLPGSGPQSLGREGLLNGAILGAVMMGWGLYLHQTIETLARADSAVLRRTLISAFTLWFLVDQFASWRAGAYGNMISNTAFYAVFMLPFAMGGSQRQTATSPA